MAIVTETNDLEGGRGNSNVTTSGSNNSRRKLFFGLAASVVIIASVITIPIVLTRNNSSTNSNTNNNNNSNEAVSAPDTTLNVSSQNTAKTSSDPNTTTTSTTSSNSTLQFTEFDKSSLNLSFTESKYDTSNGPFNASIELLSAKVVNGYKDEEDLKEGISNAANFYLGSIYKQYSNDTTMYGDDKISNGATTTQTRSGTISKSSTPLNDIGTSNQELGIEEGDLIVSDGTFAYAAYGKYLVIWNKETGDMVKTIEMPPVNITYQGNPWSAYSDIDPFQGTSAPSDFSSSSSAYNSMYYWPVEPYITSLLLHERRLLVLVSGYGETLKERTETGSSKHVLDSYLSTHIRVYDTMIMLMSNGADSGLLGSTDVNGMVNGLRSSGGIVQIAASSTVSAYEYLDNPMQELMMRTSMNDKDFETEAASLSTNYAVQLMRDLRAGENPMPNLFRINLFQNSTSDSGLEELSYSNGIMRTLAIVHTVNLTSANMSESLANISSSGAFLPSDYFLVYGTAEMILLAGPVYEYDSDVGSSKVSTALVAFSLEGATTKPHSIGTVPGSIMSSYALDIVGDTIRIATTVLNDTWVMDPMSTQVPGGMWPTPDTENFVIVMQMPGVNGTNAGLMVEKGRVQVGKPKESFTSAYFLDQVAYVMTFLYLDPFYVIDLSNASNPTAIGELEVPGFSRHMHPINANKTLFVAIGSLVDTDGLTTLGLQLTIFDVSVPTKPVATFRHDILRPSNSSSVGSDSLWDPKATRYFNGYLFLAVDIDAWDYTSGMYNSSSSFHGMMVFTVDPESGISEKTACRIPYNYPDYNDMYTDVSVDGTSMEEQDISTITETKKCNYTGGYLPRRSMVFGDNVMSTSMSEFILTDFDKCQRVWNKTIGIPANCTDYDNYYMR